MKGHYIQVTQRDLYNFSRSSKDLFSKIYPKISHLLKFIVILRFIKKILNDNVTPVKLYITVKYKLLFFLFE